MQRHGDLRAWCAWRIPPGDGGGEHDGHMRRVWGSRDEEGFSREQAWQVLEATLCLQSSEEQLGSKWSTAAISRGRELCSAP